MITLVCAAGLQRSLPTEGTSDYCVCSYRVVIPAQAEFLGEVVSVQSQSCRKLTLLLKKQLRTVEAGGGNVGCSFHGGPDARHPLIHFGFVDCLELCPQRHEILTNAHGTGVFPRHPEQKKHGGDSVTLRIPSCAPRSQDMGQNHQPVQFHLHQPHQPPASQKVLTTSASRLEPPSPSFPPESTSHFRDIRAPTLTPLSGPLFACGVSLEPIA